MSFIVSIVCYGRCCQGCTIAQRNQLAVLNQRKWNRRNKFGKRVLFVLEENGGSCSRVDALLFGVIIAQAIAHFDLESANSKNPIKSDAFS